jgi:hypothetical protein
VQLPKEASSKIKIRVLALQTLPNKYNAEKPNTLNLLHPVIFINFDYYFMKIIALLSLIIFALLQTANAQIGEVKIDGSYAKIYNDQARYTGKSIYLGSNKTMEGYNGKHIVIKDGSYAKIYNDQAVYTGKSIYLGSDKYIKNVSAAAILIKDGSYVKYYDFEGRYTGKSTYDK